MSSYSSCGFLLDISELKTPPLCAIITVTHYTNIYLHFHLIIHIIIWTKSREIIIFPTINSTSSNTSSDVCHSAIYSVARQYSKNSYQKNVFHYYYYYKKIWFYMFFFRIYVWNYGQKNTRVLNWYTLTRQHMQSIKTHNVCEGEPWLWWYFSFQNKKLLKCTQFLHGATLYNNCHFLISFMASCVNVNGQLGYCGRRKSLANWHLVE